jgi:hypothetical protein
MVVRNNHATEATGEGGSCCFDTGGSVYDDADGNSRLFGYDIDKPAAGNEEFWLGQATRSIDSVTQSTNNFGEIQVYGYMDNALVQRDGAEDPDLGDAVTPLNTEWYLWPGATPLAAASIEESGAIVVELEATMVALGTGELNIGVLLKLMGNAAVTNIA